MKLQVNEVIKRFKLEVLNSQNVDLKTPLTGFAVSRFGLELTGKVKKSQAYANNIVCWGTNENAYIKTHNDTEIKNIYARIIDKNIPMVVLSKGFNDEKALSQLIEICNQYKIPIVKYHGHLAVIVPKLFKFISASLAKTETVHGSLMAINGVGVLIKGRSGIGKSEAQLELIQKGHTFIADDSVVLSNNSGIIEGKSAPITKDLLEVRGIGLMNVPFIYGAKSIADYHKVNLIVELVEENERNKVDRLGNQNLIENVLGVELSVMQIPTGFGRSVASMIEAAVNVFIAKIKGMDPLKLIQERSGDKNNGN